MDQILQQRKLPFAPFDDSLIEYFLTKISFLDSNNFKDRIGVGEREGRVASNLVARRNFNLSHGIGRSGDVEAIQPKAAGSSLIYKLTNYLVKDALRLMGLTVQKCLVLPLATGMTLTLILLTLKAIKPNAKYVIWPRIDQKTCLKCILTAGALPIVIQPKLSQCQMYVHTDMEEMQKKV